jgi:hypothetical protein
MCKAVTHAGQSGAAQLKSVTCVIARRDMVLIHRTMLVDCILGMFVLTPTQSPQISIRHMCSYKVVASHLFRGMSVPCGLTK